MIIAGWGKKAKKLANAGIEKCPQCSNWSAFGVYSCSSTVSLYFVTVAKFSTKFYLVCSTCENGFEINEARKDFELRRSADLPSSDEMLAIWAVIDDAMARYFRASVPERAGMLTPTAATEALKAKYNPQYVDYVASRYSLSITDSGSRE